MLANISSSANPEVSAPLELTEPRKRALSDATTAVDPPSQRQCADLASAQRHQAEEMRNRDAAAQEIQRLLRIRKQKLKLLEQNEDEVSLTRLKNLDESEDTSSEASRSDGHDIRATNWHKGLSRVLIHDTNVSPPISLHRSSYRQQSVSLGHTPDLCWHLKLQAGRGAFIPEEYSKCTVHPTPTLDNVAPSPKSKRTPVTSPVRSSSRQIKVPIRSSLLRSPAGPSSTTKGHGRNFEPSSPSSLRTCVRTEDLAEEDPFLYVGRYSQAKALYRQDTLNSKRGLGRPSSRRCACANHNCRTFLSGSPSKHCRNCRLPQPDREIRAAMSRINDMMRPQPPMRGHGGSSDACEFEMGSGDTLHKLRDTEEEISVADESKQFRYWQEDMFFVETYNAEMEKRCKSGIWWEGWLIVEDLKQHGIAGSNASVT